MIKHTLIKQFIPVALLSVLVILGGCEKKTEETKQTQQEIQSEQTTPGTQEEIKKPVVEEMISIPDIKGTWTGTFDKRATTLTITEQTDSTFTGKISISYREVIDQQVKGTFSPISLKMTMTDQLHSRYEGSYSGKLSKELNNYAGTFTMKVDGSKFPFTLSKK
jgi:hypothetical protein